MDDHRPLLRIGELNRRLEVSGHAGRGQEQAAEQEDQFVDGEIAAECSAAELPTRAAVLPGSAGQHGDRVPQPAVAAGSGFASSDGKPD
jgi:hypothetical protein